MLQTRMEVVRGSLRVCVQVSTCGQQSQYDLTDLNQIAEDAIDCALESAEQIEHITGSKRPKRAKRVEQHTLAVVELKH